MDLTLLGSLFDPRPRQEGGEGGEGGTGGTGGEGGPVFDEASFGVFKMGAGELGQDKSLEPIKDFNGLLKGYIESQKMIGDSIRLPKKDLSPGDREKAVGELIGKLRTEGIMETPPDSPEKYEIAMPQLEGFNLDQPFHDSFRVAAHKHGILPSQAQGLFDWYVNEQANRKAQELAQFNAMKEGLKTEWGPLYSRRMEAARRIIAKHVGPDGDAHISELPPATAEKWLKAFSAIGDPMLEPDFTPGEGGGFETAESLKKQLTEMEGDPKGPWLDANHPGHKEAVAKYTKLYKAHALLTRAK